MDSANLRRVLARNLRAVAQRRGLALGAIADFAGVSRSQIYDVVACRKAATVDWIAKVAAALGVGAHRLLDPDFDVAD